jgi:hypothetical protein
MPDLSEQAQSVNGSGNIIGNGDTNATNGAGNAGNSVGGARHGIGDVNNNIVGFSDGVPMQVPKPTKNTLDMFKSTRDPSIAGVETLLTALPHYKLSEAKDWGRLHPDEENYWSAELCFVTVPIKGQKKDLLHLINEDVAKRYLPADRIQRFRLALATKPHDVFFLCHVPSQNLDNTWNDTNLRACLQAKTTWAQAASRKGENAEGYQITYARDQDSFPEPKWPTQSLDELILVTFNDRMITSDNHPGLLRLIGAKQSLS